MLTDAVYRCLRNEIVGFAVVVDAKNDEAQRFYESQGFVRLIDIPNRLYLRLSTIAASLIRK